MGEEGGVGLFGRVVVGVLSGAVAVALGALAVVGAVLYLGLDTGCSP